MANIYLTGMMGSGKSVTGKKLAQFLGYTFTDIDEEIQTKLGRSIPDIFQTEGEAFFREQESISLDALSKMKDKVVATGGGTVLRPENVQRMKNSGKLCYLETSLNVLWDRVRNKKDRPLLKGPEPFKNLETIFFNRRSIYEKNADFKVNTDGKTAEAVAQMILDILKKGNG